MSNKRRVLKASKAVNSSHRFKRKPVTVAGLLLCLIISGVGFAQWGMLAPTRRGGAPMLATAALAQSGQDNFDPAHPSKEYIYAGGRLIATEEPTPAPTPTPTPWPACTPPAGLVISEFRLRGSGGTNTSASATDEFVELYNNTDAAITVCTADGSGGWALAASDGVVRSVIPYNTVIPARAHYLITNSSGYSLASYGSGTAGDATYTTDIADNSGVALFNTANPANFNSTNRLDAAGFSSEANALYREGAGLASIGSIAGEYSFTRKLISGTPQDTGDNASDFIFVSTDAGAYGGVQSQLGAAGPENLASPIQRNATIKLTVIDTAVASTSAPNRERRYTAVGPNAALGTLVIRRKVTNNTGQVVTRLRFRVVDITSLNSPGYVQGGTQADLRVIDSSDEMVTLTSGAQVLVRGTVVEQPPTQGSGGGMNSTVTVALPNGALASGASVNVQFVLGVMQAGSFRFTVNTEALP